MTHGRRRLIAFAACALLAALVATLLPVDIPFLPKTGAPWWTFHEEPTIRVLLGDLGEALHPRRRGAQVVAGGQRKGDTGNFWAPTVLADVPLDARIFNDEPFGPVAAIRKFNELDEAIAEANRLSFGLAGYAFTRSLKNADLLTRKVEVGMLWINMPAMPSAEMPFGGIKESGYGSEGGPEALDAYLNTRSVAILNA